jgi:hypothetical protein
LATNIREAIGLHLRGRGSGSTGICGPSGHSRHMELEAVA